jgi:hypothetical protein
VEKGMVVGVGLWAIRTSQQSPMTKGNPVPG